MARKSQDCLTRAQWHGYWAGAGLEGRSGMGGQAGMGAVARLGRGGGGTCVFLQKNVHWNSYNAASELFALLCRGNLKKIGILHWIFPGGTRFFLQQIEKNLTK